MHYVEEKLCRRYLILERLIDLQFCSYFLYGKKVYYDSSLTTTKIDHLVC